MKQRTDTEWPETKRRLVDAGVTLMRNRGFNATSLDDICEAAGVTKGGFFHYFKSKDEIASAAVIEFAEEKARSFQNAPFRKLTDPLERVLGRVDFALESAHIARQSKGCLIGVLAQELSFTNPRIREVCRNLFSQVAKDFENDFAEAKTLHAPKASFDPKRLANLYVTIVQGSLIVSKTAESNAVMVENLEEYRRYVELLFAPLNKSNGKRTALPGSARN